MHSNQRLWHTSNEFDKLTGFGKDVKRQIACWETVKKALEFELETARNVMQKTAQRDGNKRESLAKNKRVNPFFHAPEELLRKKYPDYPVCR